MRYIKTCLILIILFVTDVRIWAGDYCIVTFTEERPRERGLFRRNMEPRIRDYLWVIPLDSLKNHKSDPVHIHPFVIDYYGEYSERGSVSYYWLDMINYPNRWPDDTLYGMIADNKRFVMQFSYSNNEYKRKTKVKVFITLVKGDVHLITSRYDNRTIAFSNSFSLKDDYNITEDWYQRILSLSFVSVPYDADYSRFPCFAN